MPKVLLLAMAAALFANGADLDRLTDRLEKLERDNQALAAEVKALRAELDELRTDQAEKAAITDARVEEQAQTKVEASQRFPLKIAGMAIFNVFTNSRQSNGIDYPTVAAPTPGRADGGATLRQSVVGLDYNNGRVRGNVYFDFFTLGQPATYTARLRTAVIAVDLWKNASVSGGLEKPIFNPREPRSFAQVGVSPLTGAGNLWLWLPQVKFEQKFELGGATGLHAQIGFLQTREVAPYQASAYTTDIETRRPSVEGRFELAHRFASGRKFEIAPGFHVSESHTAKMSVPSRVISLDGFLDPIRRVQFTYNLYKGENVTHLGTGGVRQGITALGDRQAFAVHSQGGWAQTSLIAATRLTFNLFTGLHDDRNRDLRGGGRIDRNWVYGANAMYQIAPNVYLSFESSQTRTRYLTSGDRLNNHYDLALAYLF